MTSESAYFEQFTGDVLETEAVDLRQQLADSRERERRLRETLKWYANSANYDRRMSIPGSRPAVMDDCGFYASRVLREIEELP